MSHASHIRTLFSLVVKNISCEWKCCITTNEGESEFVALLSMVDEINKQIKKTKKIARKERQHSDDESENNFTQVPLPPMQKKGQTNILHPAVIQMILQVVVKKLLKVQTWEKEGPKSLNLQRKRKQKNGERK